MLTKDDLPPEGVISDVHTAKHRIGEHQLEGGGAGLEESGLLVQPRGELLGGGGTVRLPGVRRPLPLSLDRAAPGACPCTCSGVNFRLIGAILRFYC